MYSVVKRDGRVIEFDISKIREAIQKALEAVKPVLEEIDEIAEESIGNIERGLYTFVHSLAHWVHRTFYLITSRNKKAICFDPYSAVRLAIVVKIRVKLLTAVYLEYAHVQRAVSLLRTQDRGGEDNSDSDDIKSFALSLHYSGIITIDKGVPVMITALENYIADSMEESMQPYINSKEYQSSKAAINTKIIDFRSGLDSAQKKEFNLLMDEMNNAYAEFVSKAFVTGVVNGIALREQILKP